jgi:hypothetical protein
MQLSERYTVNFFGGTRRRNPSQRLDVLSWRTLRVTNTREILFMITEES